MFMYHIFITPPGFRWMLVLSRYKEIIYNFFNVCPFDYAAVAVSWKVGIP